MPPTLDKRVAQVFPTFGKVVGFGVEMSDIRSIDGNASRAFKSSRDSCFLVVSPEPSGSGSRAS